MKDIRLRILSKKKESIYLHKKFITKMESELVSDWGGRDHISEELGYYVPYL